MKEKLRQFATLGKCIVISLIFLTIANILWPRFLDPIIYLSENQLLYFFSTEAQVIGSLFGLTLTAFIFFIDKFNETPEEVDSIIQDAIKQLKKEYYQNL